MIKKGQAKAQKAKERRDKIEEAGEKGTPERKAEIDRLRLVDEKHAKRMSKWRKTRAKSDAKRTAIAAHAKPEEKAVSLDALTDTISAAPADFLVSCFSLCFLFTFIFSNIIYREMQQNKSYKSKDHHK